MNNSQQPQTDLLLGLYKDFSPNKSNERALYYAENTIIQTHRKTTLSSEPGNVFCIDLKNEYPSIEEPYIVATTILNSDNTKIAILSEGGLGVLDTSNCQYQHLLDNTNCLDISRYRPTQLICVTEHPDECTDVLYWTDGVTPEKRYNMNRPNDYNDCNDFLLEPTVQWPNIIFNSYIQGGKIEYGSYAITVRYLTPQGTPITEWSEISRPVPITAGLNVSNFGVEQGGLPPTHLGIRWNIENLDTRFSYIEIALVQFTSGDGIQTECYGTQEVIQIGNSRIDFNFTQIKKDNQIDLSEILQKRIRYETSKHINVIQNRIVRANLTEKNPDYSLLQNAANNVYLKYQIKEVDEVSQTGGLMRDEVYAVGIVFIHKDGWESLVHPIPGRKPEHYSNGAAFPVWYNDPNLYQDPNAPHSRPRPLPTFWDQSPYFNTPDSAYTPTPHPRWRLYNTAIRQSPLLSSTSTGEFGVWLSSETYPNELDCNSQRVYPTGLVRLIKTPDTIIEPLLSTTGKLRQLGIKVDNVILPQDYVGYRIVIAKRTESNKTVLDKGVVYRATQFRQAGNSNNPAFDIKFQSPWFNKEFDEAIALSGPLNWVPWGTNAEEKLKCNLSGNLTVSDWVFQSTEHKYRKAFPNGEYFKYESALDCTLLDIDIVDDVADSQTVNIITGARRLAKAYSMTVNQATNRIPTNTNIKIGTIRAYEFGDYDLEFVNNNQQSIISLESSDDYINKPALSFPRAASSSNQQSFYTSIKNIFSDPYNSVFSQSWYSPDKIIHTSSSTIINDGFDTYINQIEDRRTHDLVSCNGIARHSYFIRILHTYWGESSIPVHFTFNGEDTCNKGITGYKRTTDFLFLEKDRPEYDTSRPAVVCSNWYGFNEDYTPAQLNTKYTISKTWDYCDECKGIRKNLLVWSDPFPNVRYYKPLNSLNVPVQAGAITWVWENKNFVVALCENTIVILPLTDKVPTIQDSNLYLGNAEFLSLLPEYIKVNNGWAGCQHWQTVQETNYGLFWVDSLRKTIWRYTGDGPTPISQNGLEKWSYDNLDVNVLSTSSAYQTGYTSVWDAVNKRYILHKQEIVPIADGLIYDNVTHNWYDSENRIVSPYFDFNPNNEQERIFQNNSWTISYSPVASERGAFLSFHSYQPHHFQTVNDGFYSSGSGTDLWLHTLNTLPCNFYGVQKDMIVDFIFSFTVTSPRLSNVWISCWGEKPNQNLEYETYPYLYAVWNNNQFTGPTFTELVPQYITIPWNGAVAPIEKRNSYYTLSRIRDYSVDNSLQSVFEINSQTGSRHGLESIQFTNYNPLKEQHLLKHLNSNFFRIRLYFNHTQQEYVNLEYITTNPLLLTTKPPK